MPPPADFGSTTRTNCPHLQAGRKKLRELMRRKVNRTRRVGEAEEKERDKRSSRVVPRKANAEKKEKRRKNQEWIRKKNKLYWYEY